MLRTPLLRFAITLAMLLTACGGGAASTSAPAAPPPPIVTSAASDDLRVVTDSVVLAGHLSSVGLLPVGALDGTAEWLQPYADAGVIGDLDPADIESAGPEAAFDLERVAALDPDLILIEEFSADLEPQLSQIAPTTIISRPTNADWKDAFDQTVTTVGRQAQAEPVIARYEGTVDAALDADEEVITFIRGSGPGMFRLDVLGGFGGSVAEEAGYAVDTGGATAAEAGESWIEFSNESLGVVTGTVLVTTTQEDGGPSNIDELTASPLWEQIPAVDEDRVLELPQSIYNGGTYVAAELLLDALADALGGAAASTETSAID